MFCSFLMQLALVVAQHRDKRNNLSGIKLSALSEGLQRIYKAAKLHTASVHLPRIGHNTPGFNWYGTERLIRKYLSAKGIPTYMYPLLFLLTYRYLFKYKSHSSIRCTPETGQRN